MCEFISDHVLKHLEDKYGAKISAKLRAKRSGFKRFFQNFFVKSLTPGVAGRKRETYTTNNTTNLPGTLLMSETSPLSQDLVANEAHVNSANVYAYFAAVFNRNSLDNKGGLIKSTVHYDKNYNNAFWNNTEMVYGDGDGKFFIPLTKGLDVCAHEMSHAVTSFTCNLMYLGQSGALNESFSDMMGKSCEHWVNKEFVPENANWILGDKIVGSEFPGKGIRSFKNEKAYTGDSQPKHMKNFYIGMQDNGGVHINSGIPNHMFYNLCLIMKQPSYGKPIQIVYNAHTKYVGQFTNFSGYAKAMVKSAQELYGAEAVDAVKQAWSIVGIKV